MPLKSRPTTLNISLLLAGLVTLPAAALAQQAGSGEPAKPGQEQAAQEVVVTASRRPERLQDVPLAVTAVSADLLNNAGIKNIIELGSVVSGVSFGVSPGDAGLRIRGAGQMGGFASSAETPVGVVVDNVVYGLGQFFDSMGDLERVEILKGPQGTQFGKNASSGVVSITTPRPTMDRVKADAFTSIGNDNELEVRGAINIPLGESTAARFSVYQRKFDGMVANPTRNETWGGQTQKGFRGKLLYAPNKQFDAQLIVDASSADVKGPLALFAMRTPPAAIMSGHPVNGGPMGSVFPAGTAFGPDNTAVYEDAPGYVTSERSGASLELNYYVGGYTLTSISAYRTDKSQSVFAIDGTPIDTFKGYFEGDKTQTTQELRVTSPKSSRVEYVAGYYYYKQPTDQIQSGYVRPALPFAPIYAPLSSGIATSTTDSVSHALFADGKLRISDNGLTKLLFGVRVNRDQVSATNMSVRDPALDQLPVVPYEPIPFMSGKTSKVGNSGRLGLEHRIHKDLLLYGTVATGFLGPTVAYSSATSTRTDVNPQKVRDITLGFKSQFLNRWITFNGALFSDQYTDLQTALFRNGEFVTENAGAARSRGVELDLSARLNPELRVRASATYADAVFTDYLTACPEGRTAGCSGPIVDGQPRDFQAAGEPISGAAKVSAVAGIDYVTETADERIFNASATYAYRSKISYQVGVPAAVQGAYGTLNLVAHYGASDLRWRVGAYVRNALDRRFHAAVLPLPLASAGGIANWPTYEGAGRHLGVTLELRY